MGVNKVILIGHLGKDPEIRYTQSGNAVANFSLATSESRKDKDGNKIEKTEWHKVIIFGKLAEICGEYLTKGKKVYLEGKIQYSQWDDKDGNKQYTTEIVCFQMQMLNEKGQGNSAPKEEKQPEGETEALFDDIPDSFGDDTSIPF